MSQYGVQETKEVLDLMFAGGGAVKSALADGKLDLNDLAYLMPVVMSAGPAFQDISKVPKELGDLDEDEAKDLVAYMSQKLGPLVPEPVLKEKIEKGLKLALSLAEFLIVLKK